MPQFYKNYMLDIHEEFLKLLRSTERPGIENVIQDLEEWGFFKAPASTRFHLNCEGGLMQHSYNVCTMALELREMMLRHDDSLRESLPKDSVILAALLHDVCKADIYRRCTKRQKNTFGLWEDVEGYEVDYSNFPMGHGEKSVILLLCSGLEMSDDEMLAIRWHMSAWDLPMHSADAKGNYNTAKDICPLVALIQSADSLASNLLERDNN